MAHNETTKGKVGPKTYESFLPREGISEAVLIKEVKKRFGPEALVQLRSSKDGEQNYIITAPGHFSISEQKHLKNESKFAFEQNRSEVSLKALAHACTHNDLEEAKRLLTRGVNPNLAILYRDETGDTLNRDYAQLPITRALHHGHWSTATILIESDARVDAKNDRGLTTLLELSSDDKYATAVQWLLKQGADFEARTQYDGRTPLHLAILSRSSNIVSVLLKGGANLHSVDSLEFAGMHLAAAENFPEIISTLIENGADIEVKTSMGASPLCLAIIYMKLDSVRCLVDLGAKRDSRTVGGKTLLEIAFNQGLTDILEVLAGPNTEDYPIHRTYHHENDTPFKKVHFLGKGGSAIVDKVQATDAEYIKAGRFFARKSIAIGKYQPLDRKMAEEEVSLLRKLQHQHVVKAIASYSVLNPEPFGPEVYMIIISPVSDCTLGVFLKSPAITSVKNRQLLQQWFGCLAAALYYLHGCGIRHKDIKPENLLIKDENILFTDFGLSKKYQNESSTSGPLTGLTRKYCAPEVADQDRRGKSSDIFSLGCCFLEMATVLCGESLEKLAKATGNYAGGAYHANMDEVIQWISILARNNSAFSSSKYSNPSCDAVRLCWRLRTLLKLCFLTLQPSKSNRPTARQIVVYLKRDSGPFLDAQTLLYGICCHQDILKLEAHSPPGFRLWELEPFMRKETLNWDDANRTLGMI